MATSDNGKHLPVLSEDCSGRTFIVTGGNVGLGYEAAKRLVLQRATRVILAVRNLSAGNKAKAELEVATGKAGVLQVWHLDLASYDSVKAFARKAIDELDRIDVLIENAAVFPTDQSTAEGHHLAVTVNVLSTLLLAGLLLPKLSETARMFDTVPRLAIVGSNFGFFYAEDWQTLKDDPLNKLDATEDKDISRNYPLSKLIDIFLVRHLCSLLPFAKTGVVVNILCPGLCRTTLARTATPEMKAVLEERFLQFGRTAEEGSRCLLHGAFVGKESHGLWLEDCRIAEDKLPGWVTDEEGQKSAEHVWAVVSEELEKIEPGWTRKLLVA